MRLIAITISLLMSVWLYSQTDTFALVGKGIDTSILKINTKKEWIYNGEKCNGPKSIYYTSGFYQGRLDRVVWFTKGKIDSVVIYSLAFFPSNPTILAVQSKVKIDIRRNRRYYVIFSSSEILWARYEYKIINAYDLSSPLKLITIDQDIRYVDDGCQYDYHQNGKLKSAGAYVLGNRESDWKYYDEAGQLLKTEKYKNNVLLSTVPNQ